MLVIFEKEIKKDNVSVFLILANKETYNLNFEIIIYKSDILFSKFEISLLVCN